MLEIVENNNKLMQPIYESTCPRCNSVFRFSLTHFRVNTVEKYKGMDILKLPQKEYLMSQMFHIICPCCNKDYNRLMADVRNIKEYDAPCEYNAPWFSGEMLEKFRNEQHNSVQIFTTENEDFRIKNGRNDIKPSKKELI